MSLILTTAIEKGGTGKTTTVVNLAALMAAEGKRVLVVDMDQQANTTYMLTQHKKAENFYKGHGLVNMFMNFDLGGMDLTPYIHPTNVEGVHIIPSTAQTPRAVHQLDLLADEYKMKNYTFLIHCLANINEDYDYIVIDTPPARDNLTMSALFCADEVLIPVRCDNFSLEGFETTLAMILDLETREDVKIDILGVVLTQVERTAAVNLVRQMFEENPEYASVLFKTGIRKGSAVPESTIAAIPVVRYAKKSNPSVDYMQLWNEIKQRLAKKEADE